MLFWGDDGVSIARGAAMFIAGVIGLALEAISSNVKLIADVFGQYRDDRRGLHDPDLPVRSSEAPAE